MSRLLISSFTFISVLSLCNVVSAGQQSPVYASQAGTVQPYDPSQYSNNNSYGNDNGQYGSNQYGNNMAQQNNSQYNNSWQNNNQYGSNNNQTVNNGSHNNQNTPYGTQNNNNQYNNRNSANNPFLNNYVRKNKVFSASVYKLDKNGKLYKTTLDNKSLKKTVVIFFGDWCPNCAKFLGSLSKYLKQLLDSGINIIFIGVPKLEEIRDWRKPSISDYNNARNQLRQYKILLEQLDPNGYDSAGNPNKKSKKVELVLLGDSDVLEKNDITVLPTMLAINNGTEQFRGSSDNSLDIVNFENPTAIQQFQEIWNTNNDDDNDDDEEEDETEDEDDDEEECKPKKKVTNKKKQTNTNRNGNKKKKKLNVTSITVNKKKTSSKNSRVDKKSAEFHTRMLNSGCQCSCNKNLPPLIKIHNVAPQPVAPVQQPVANNVNNIEQDDKYCYVTKTKRYIKQKRPVICHKQYKNNQVIPTNTNTISNNNGCYCTCN